jgi:peptide chain release factor subunit 1
MRLPAAAGYGRSVQLSDVTDVLIGRLARRGPGGPPIVSLYVNLDPSRFPTPRERSAQLSALLDQAEQHGLEAVAGLARDERMALRSDVDRLRHLFDDPDAAKGAHGVAAFASGANGLFEVVKLPHSVDPSVTVNRFPRVLPLLAQLASARWAVLLVSRTTARIMRGNRDRLVEIATFSDDVHRRHEQGGWSQARYQRGIDKEVHDHAKRAATALFEDFESRSLDDLIVGCSDELWPELESTLHPYLRERVRARMELDVDRSTAEEVHRRAAPLVAASEQERERAALERLGAGLGRNGGAAVGADEVVTALNEHRVKLLLLVRDARFSGAACPRCGWLSISTGGRCPVDNSSVEPTDALAERVAQAVLRNGGEVLLVHHDDAELVERGSIAAMLRY